MREVELRAARTYLMSAIENLAFVASEQTPGTEAHRAVLQEALGHLQPMVEVGTADEPLLEFHNNLLKALEQE